MNIGWRISWLTAMAAASTQPARSIIFYKTGDPTYNTTAPTGSLANSGWEMIGNWQGYCGIPVGRNFFISAAHIGGAVGQTFTWNGASYSTIASFHDPQTDLILWEISGSFPSWVSLYQGSDEMDKPLVVFGRGLSRGDPITVNGVLKGWMWGVNGSTLRWGQNTVAAITDAGPGLGQMLYATFDAPGVGVPDNEAHLAVGDSSGGVFVQENGVWKLAGIAYAVDAFFNTTNTGGGFDAALFDARGLYYGTSGNWTLVGGPSAVPSGFYATRVSARLAWIESIVPSDESDVPFPSFALYILAAGLVLLAAPSLRRTG